MINSPPGAFTPPAPSPQAFGDPTIGYGDVVILPIRSTAASVLLLNRDARLLGFVISENTGAAGARAIIHDGTDNTGEILGGAAVIANGFGSAWFGWNGVPARTGIFLEVTAGTVVGSCYIRVRGQA